jgi:hypothetical protein
LEISFEFFFACFFSRVSFSASFLKAGEYDPKSQLYPLSTPIKELSDFGKEVGLAFLALDMMVHLTSLCSIVVALCAH